MKQFSEQLQKQSEKIRLSAMERDELRERLTTYMEYHPLPASMRETATAKQAATKAGIVAEPFKVLRFNGVFFKAVVPTMALVMLVAVPVLAERTAPGDILYPVKVSFNEEIRSQLASSPYEQIEWEASRIERRIAEARLLASEGRLTEEVEAEVAEAVKEQTAKTKERIAALKSTDADEGAIAEISFASTLAVQSEMLEADVDADGARDPKEAGAVLASVVAEESSAAEAAQEQSAPSYEKLLARLESETTNAEELFASIEDDARQTEVSDIERRLSDIARKVDRARTVHNAPAASSEEVATASTMVAASSSTSSEPAVAAVAPAAGEKTDVELLREAMTDVRKLISFMTNIDVRTAVTVEELVPVDATDDERWAAVNDVSNVAQALLERAETVSIENEKVTRGVSQLEEQLTALDGAITRSDVAAAEILADEIMALTTDLERMMPMVDPEVDPEPVEEDRASSTKPVEIDEPTSSSTDEVSLPEPAAVDEVPVATTSSNRATTAAAVTEQV